MQDAHKLGLAAYKNNDFEYSITLFSQAIEQNRQRAQSYHARAKSYENLGRVKDALKDVAVVVKLMPDSYEGYFLAGRLYAQAGKLEKGKQLLEQAKIKLEQMPSQGDQVAVRIKAVDRELDAVNDQIKFERFCPFTTLPTELFLEIISHLLHSHHSPSSTSTLCFPHRQPNGGSPTPVRNPLLVASAVNKQWRRTIENASWLWSNLMLDGGNPSRAREKARFWAGRAVGGAVNPLPRFVGKGGSKTGWRQPIKTKEEDIGGGNGITSLAITQVANFNVQGFSELLSELTMLDAFPSLQSISISWVEASSIKSSVLPKPQSVSTQIHQHQLTNLFIFLRDHAHSLRTLELHSPLHLKLNFSLPRFTHTFSSLRSLSLHAASGTKRVTDVFLLPSSLNPYSGEEDWPTLPLESLTLVGPIWRLIFEDGTFASPSLSAEDCGKLREIDLGPTSPCMTWELFGLEGLRKVKVLRHGDQPTLKDPEVGNWREQVQELALVDSPALGRRLLNLFVDLTNDLGIVPGGFFPNLTIVNLQSAILTSSHLSLFSEISTPHLISLNLAGTSPVTGLSARLPQFSPTLHTLDLSNTRWLDREDLVGLRSLAPGVRRIDVSFCGTGMGSWVMELLKRVDEANGEKFRELMLLGTDGISVEQVKWIAARVEGKNGFRHSFPELM
ncbi:hypothetical protein T439DRAFT_112873 [Meredithblackwellia eburnea MCA 4105]